MPKRSRLTGAEIRRSVPEKRLSSALFTATLSQASTDAAKVACVVSKKVSLKATVRNTVKRRMRAALRNVSLPTGYATVLSAKPPASRASFAEIERDIEALIIKLRGAVPH